MKRIVMYRRLEDDKYFWFKSVEFLSAGIEVVITDNKALAMDVPVEVEENMMVLLSQYLKDTYPGKMTIPMHDTIRDASDIQSEIIDRLHCTADEEDRDNLDCRLDCTKCRAKIGRLLEDFFEAKIVEQVIFNYEI